MNILKLNLLILFALIGPVLCADPAPTAPAVPPSVNLPSVVEDPIAEPLAILQSKYPDFSSLNYKPEDRLSDLISRSNGGISLISAMTIATKNPVISSALPDGIFYWRLASFTPKTSWPDLATELDQANENTLGIVLDLRSNVAPDDFTGAAQAAAFFIPTHANLFSEAPDKTANLIFQPPQIFRQPIVVLVNHKTNGAAEALAELLQHQGALVIGQPTMGRVAQFASQTLSSGEILRYKIAPLSLADGTDLWNHPVTPDIGVKADDRSEVAALVLIRDNHISDVIQESAARHRMSEASLVKGQDPELDDYLSSLEKKPFLLSLPVIHDTALISALDSLKAIRLSQKTLPAQVQASASLPASSSVQ
jgi:Peptidase family S41